MESEVVPISVNITNAPRVLTGRPWKFKTVEELQTAIDDYFAVTPEKEITTSGLALHLGIYREMLMEYQERDVFANAVKMAKLRIHNEYEKDLRRAGRVGDIFALKQFGWKDKQEIDQTVHGSVDLSFKDASTDDLLRLSEADVIDI